MSTRCECRATFSPRFLPDFRRGKHRIGRDDADYILETFPIVKRHDEAEFGEYRTKRVIVERFGEYGEAIKRNQSEGFALKPDAPLAIPSGDLPPVPAHPTIATILDYLARLGIQVENNRAKGGGLRVYLGTKEFGRVAEQWEVDPGKRLG